jgi:hypothetical protein
MLAYGGGPSLEGTRLRPALSGEPQIGQAVNGASSFMMVK